MSFCAKTTEPHGRIGHLAEMDIVFERFIWVTFGTFTPGTVNSGGLLEAQDVRNFSNALEIPQVVLAWSLTRCRRTHKPRVLQVRMRSPFAGKRRHVGEATTCGGRLYVLKTSARWTFGELKTSSELRPRSWKKKQPPRQSAILGHNEHGKSTQGPKESAKTWL